MVRELLEVRQRSHFADRADRLVKLGRLVVALGIHAGSVRIPEERVHFVREVVKQLLVRRRKRVKASMIVATAPPFTSNGRRFPGSRRDLEPSSLAPWIRSTPFVSGEACKLRASYALGMPELYRPTSWEKIDGGVPWWEYLHILANPDGT
jgi:hypothetical protein